MTITGGSALPKDDIERMMKDAEAHAEEDKKRREEAETRNLAESLQYQTEKFLAENGDKIPAEKKDELGEALTELRSALGGSDIDAIKAAQEKVARVSQEIGGAMYAQHEAAAGAGESADGAAAGDAGRLRSATTTSSTPRSSTRATTSGHERAAGAARRHPRQAAHRPGHGCGAGAGRRAAGRHRPARTRQPPQGSR